MQESVFETWTPHFFSLKLNFKPLGYLLFTLKVNFKSLGYMTKKVLTIKIFLQICHNYIIGY